jgi:hypothetical protein
MHVLRILIAPLTGMGEPDFLDLALDLTLERRTEC